MLHNQWRDYWVPVLTLVWKDRRQSHRIPHSRGRGKTVFDFTEIWWSALIWILLAVNLNMPFNFLKFYFPYLLSKDNYFWTACFENILWVSKYRQFSSTKMSVHLPCVGSIWPDTGDEFSENMLLMLHDGTFHVHNRADHYYHSCRLLPFPWKQRLDFHQCPHNPHSSELSDFSSYCNTYVRAHSVVSGSLWPCGLEPTRLLCWWDFPRQEYWNKLPFPPPGDLPDPGIQPVSPALAGSFFTIEPLGSPTATLSNGHCLKQCLSTCTSFRDDSCIVLDEDSGSKRESWRTEC